MYQLPELPGLSKDDLPDLNILAYPLFKKYNNKPWNSF